MRLVLSLAWRNIFRNLRRTVITAGAVVFGVWLQILGFGFVAGIDDNVLNTSADTLTGDVLLRPVGYPDDGLSYPLEDAAALPAALEGALAAEGARSARVLFQPRLVAGADATRALVVAYEPAADAATFPRDRWSIDGAWPTPGALEVAVGGGIAHLLDLSVGDPLIVESRTLAGAYNALRFTVSGIAFTDNLLLDMNAAWMLMGDAETLLALGGARTHVALALPRPGEADPALAEALSRDGWVATTARQENEAIIAIGRIRKVMVTFVVFIIMLIAATGIANTVIMAAYERVREIGTLMAMGMSRQRLRTMFLIEGAFMGLSSALVGALLGSAMVYYYQVNGFTLGDEINQVNSGISLSSTLYLRFTWPPVIGSVVFAVLVAVLSSLYPARVASSMMPADAVRAE